MQYKIFRIVTLALFFTILKVESKSKDATGTMNFLLYYNDWVNVEQAMNLWSRVADARSAAIQKLYEHYTKSLTTIRDRVKTISQLDISIRANLKSKFLDDQQNQCVIDAASFINQTISFSGYKISNCIKDNIANGSYDLADFNRICAIDNKIFTLQKSVIDGLIGSNIFVQFNQIEYSIQKSSSNDFWSIGSDVDFLSNLVIAQFLPDSWNYYIANMDSCLDDVQHGVENGLAYIEATVIPTCQGFMK